MASDVTGPVRLTPRQLADRLGRTVKTLRNWRHARKGPEYTIIHGRIAYDLHEVEAWEREHTKPGRARKGEG